MNCQRQSNMYQMRKMFRQFSTCTCVYARTCEIRAICLYNVNACSVYEHSRLKTNIWIKIRINDSFQSHSKMTQSKKFTCTSNVKTFSLVIRLSKLRHPVSISSLIQNTESIRRNKNFENCTFS